MSDQLLETLQADVVAILKATPSLALAKTLLNDAETTDSKVENAVKTLAGPGGKRGLALVVLRPEITEGEKNLPGPPLTLRIEVQCVEQPLLNRGTDGTGIRSSQAALRVLSALQLSNLGTLLLYTDKDPIKAVQVKTGYVSDAVTLYAKFGGFVTPRPLAVQAAMAGAVRITGSLTNGTNPITFPDLLFDSVINGGDYYVATISGGLAELVFTGTEWYLQYSSTFPNQSAFWKGSGTGNTLPENIAWTPQGAETGTPILARVAGNVQLITLACDSPSSTIRYTTDGSYPSPAKTLYTTPLTGLSVGTVVRAAAYVEGMPPGDVLEFTVKD